MPKHLTVEELFGTSLPKEHSTVSYSTSERADKTDAACRDRSLLLPFSFEQSAVIHQPLGKVDGISFKSNSCTLLTQDCVPPLVIASPSEANKVSNYTAQLSPVLNSAAASETPCMQMLQSGSSNVVHVMPQASKQMSPLLNQSSSDMNHGVPAKFFTPLSVTNTGDTSNMPLPNTDLLQKLRLTPQHDQMQQLLNKAPVAANISSASAVSQLATPDCFKESHMKQQALSGKKIPPVQVIGWAVDWSCLKTSPLDKNVCWLKFLQAVISGSPFRA